MLFKYLDEIITIVIIAIIINIFGTNILLFFEENFYSNSYYYQKLVEKNYFYIRLQNNIDFSKQKYEDFKTDKLKIYIDSTEQYHNICVENLKNIINIFKYISNVEYFLFFDNAINKYLNLWFYENYQKIYSNIFDDDEF